MNTVRSSLYELYVVGFCVLSNVTISVIVKYARESFLTRVLMAALLEFSSSECLKCDNPSLYDYIII